MHQPKKNATLKSTPLKYTLKLGFAKPTCFANIERIFWSLPPIFGGRTNIYVSKV